MQQEMARLAGAVLLRQFFRPTGEDVGRGKRIVDCGLRIPAFRPRIILLNFIWFTHTFSLCPFGRMASALVKTYADAILPKGQDYSIVIWLCLKCLCGLFRIRSLPSWAPRQSQANSSWCAQPRWGQSPPPIVLAAGPVAALVYFPLSLLACGSARRLAGCYVPTASGKGCQATG